MNLSLTSGLIPITLQILALAAIVVAIGRGRSREWLRRWLLVAVLAGVGLAAAGRLIVRDQGWSADAIAFGTVFWTAMLGFTATVLIAGWRGSEWWRRLVAILSVVLVVVIVSTVGSGGLGGELRETDAARCELGREGLLAHVDADADHDRARVRVLRAQHGDRILSHGPRGVAAGNAD